MHRRSLPSRCSAAGDIPMSRQWLLGKGDSDFFFDFFKSVAHVRSTRVPRVVSHTGLTRTTKIQTNGLLILKREKKVVKF